MLTQWETRGIFVFLLCSLIAVPEILFSQSKEKEHLRTITIDVRKEKGYTNTMFKECVGAGRANEGLRADWQEQLRTVKKECGFTYIRMHGLLSDDMGVYREDRSGTPRYNFQYIDVLYDFILSIGMKPFVELSFMPSALASGTQTIFWWRGNVTPPKDYGKWEDLIRNFVQHVTNRYGSNEVATWCFEVWNEPNLSGFWSGTQEEYFKLYTYTARAIKSVNPQYRVGGPATAGAAWESDLIAFCHKNSIPLDFISTHAYGVDQGFLDEFGEAGTILSKNPMNVSSDILTSHEEIAQSPMPQLELHYTEWSSSYTPSDPIHDSYHQAAYILQKIKQVGAAANSMSYWVFTDIFEESGPRFTPFHGGFGLLNYQGIKKPAYHAYAFLNKLGTIECENTDSASWACKSTNGDVQILFWDYTYTLPPNTNNQQYYNKNLPAKHKGSVVVRLSGVSPGYYQMEVYSIGYKRNDPYTYYLQIQAPAQLTQTQVEFLKNQSSGTPLSTELIEVKNAGTVTKEFPLYENDVYLLYLRKL